MEVSGFFICISQEDEKFSFINAIDNDFHLKYIKETVNIAAIFIPR